KQLLDAVAVGQFTPGPVFTTATFIGYLIKGFSGAIAATVGIFLPSFLLVWLINPYINKLRNSKAFSSILDGVNLASLALMAGVLIKLGYNSITNLASLFIFIVSFIMLYKTKINSAILIFLGGIIGYFL
ncbi:MAG: chromate transporter, partial [Fusobacteriaceae bacterium]|nr:chromate transporter [Fusobacteriaceae bacterium]